MQLKSEDPLACLHNLFLFLARRTAETVSIEMPTFQKRNWKVQIWKPNIRSCGWSSCFGICVCVFFSFLIFYDDEHETNGIIILFNRVNQNFDDVASANKGD